MEHSIDVAKGWFWDLDETPIPPLCLELVLRDQSRYWVQSVTLKDDTTKTMVVRIWDLRAIATDSLIAKMNEQIRAGKSLSNLDCPELDVGNLRIHIDDVWYCIEWHNRYWPEEFKNKIGFDTGKEQKA